MPDTGPRFAILQRSLEIPDVDRLKHAFRSVKCLTDSDAHTLARDAFGILVKNLSPNDAMTLLPNAQRADCRKEDLERPILAACDDCTEQAFGAQDLI